MESKISVIIMFEYKVEFSNKDQLFCVGESGVQIKEASLSV